MSDDKPDAFNLEGFENIACALYFEGHFQASQRMLARDLHEQHPDVWPTFGDALEEVKSMGNTSLSDEEKQQMKRRGHMNLCMMGGFGDLSEEDIP